MRRLGVLLNNLGPNQLAQSVLLSGIQLAEANSDLDVIAFHQEGVIPQFEPAFAVMNVTECYGFSGPVVATSLSTAESLLRFPGPSGRALYVWDLEWMRGLGLPYHEYARIYRGLPLIARSEEHKYILEDLWRVKVAGVVEDACLEGLASLMKG